MLRRAFVLSSLALLLILTACDGSGPEAAPEPHFKLAAGAPVNASVEGAATLGTNLSFGEQNVFAFPIQRLGKTLTIVQLSGTYRDSITHDLSFIRLADGALEAGTYEVGVDDSCDSCSPWGFPEAFFTASYGRQTADSLHFYPLESGTVEVTTATDEVVKGTFTLEAAFEASVSRADMAAFRDSLRAGPPSDSTDFPRPPEPTVTALDPSMMIEGRFTATPGTVSNGLPRPQWSMGGGIVTP